MALIDLNRVKFKPDLDYMTKAELDTFKKLRESGRITFFKCGNCRVCGAEIIKDKLYCSQTCKEESNGTMDVEH